MLPKTRLGEKEHRKHKRQMEITIAIDEILNILRKDSCTRGDVSILEFGSGSGFQIPYLKSIGNVVASDIYTSDDIKKIQDIEFVECGITTTPFDNGQCDIMFSSHVIEHIEDVTNAFCELHRIGKPSCIYAFSVPTNIWLLLSIPAQYYVKFRWLIERFLSTPSASKRTGLNQNTILTIHKRNVTKKNITLLQVFPTGHGVYPNFIDCYHNFKINRWRQLFSDNGFSIIRSKPLLLYGPSEWPILPTKRGKSDIELNLN